MSGRLNWLSLQAGTYTVSYSPVLGHTTPPAQSVTIRADLTTEVIGTFAQNGFMHIATSPPLPGEIMVDGIARDAWGVSSEFAPGSHSVCFGPALDRLPPPCQTVTVAAGEQVEVTGVYPDPGSSSALSSAGK